MKMILYLVFQPFFSKQALMLKVLEKTAVLFSPEQKFATNWLLLQ